MERIGLATGVWADRLIPVFGYCNCTTHTHLLEQPGLCPAVSPAMLNERLPVMVYEKVKLRFIEKHDDDARPLVQVCFDTIDTKTDVEIFCYI